MRTFMALLLLTLSGCAYDPGGSIFERRELVLSGKVSRIRGLCASACTMHLYNACVEPNAVLVFHGPSRVSGPPLTPKEYKSAVNFIAAHYPDPLALWYRTGGHKKTTTVLGRDVPGARVCET